MPDEPDLPRLLAEEAGWLHRLARGLLRDEAAAADVAQDAAALALAKRPEFAGSPQRARGWLRAVASRLARARRREARERQRRELALASRAAARDPAERLELHELLLAAVRALDEPYRSVVVLRYFEDCPPREIARRKQVPVATVRKQLERGLALLRGRLQARFGDGAWRAALAGIVGPFTGSVTMGAKKVCIVAALAVGLGGVAYWSSPGETPPEHVAEPRAGELRAAAVRDARGSEPEREALAAAAKAEPEQGATVRVLDAAERPLEGAQVFAWRKGDETHLTAVTDATGTARLPEADGEGTILVSSPGLIPAWREAVHLPGRHEVALGRGRALLGQVRIRGEVPEAPLVIQLLLRHDAWDVLPDSLHTWHARQRREPGTAFSLTAPDGTFAFHGLPETYRATVGTGKPFTLDPKSTLWKQGASRPLLHGVSVDHTVPFVQLDLVALPHRWCRLVYEDDGSPAVPASLTYVLTVTTDDHQPIRGTTVDDQGRFVLVAHGPVAAKLLVEPLPRLLAARLQIDYASSRRVVELHAQDLSGDGELQVRLPRVAVRQQRFRIVDASGMPIAGAFLDGVELSQPTDARGFGTTLVAGERPKSVTLGAPRFAFREVATPPAGELWEFELHEGNRLRVSARGFDGQVPEGVKLDVIYSECVFAHAADDRPTRLHYAVMGRERSGSLGGSNAKTGLTWHDFALDEAGRVDLFDLAPATPLRVELRDAMDIPIVGRDVSGIGPTERQEITLELLRAGTVVRAIVRDEAGRPLRGARVSAGLRHDIGRGYRHAAANTDGEGRAVLPPLYSDPADLRLEVTMAGYVTERLGRPAHEEVVVRLTRSVELEVRVVDDRGEPVAARYLSVDPGESQAGDIGVFLLSGLRPGEVSIRAHVGCHQIERVFDSRKGPARFVVPRTGRVRIEAPSLPGDAEMVPVVLSAASEKTSTWTLHLHRTGDALVAEAPALIPGRYHLRWPDTDTVLHTCEVQAGAETRAVLDR